MIETQSMLAAIWKKLLIEELLAYNNQDYDNIPNGWKVLNYKIGSQDAQKYENVQNSWRLLVNENK